MSSMLSLRKRSLSQGIDRKNIFIFELIGAFDKINSKQNINHKEIIQKYLRS